jgi:hypothetical protein
MSKRFYCWHPDPWPRPSLREQIIALEEASGLTVYMLSENLCIDVDTTTSPEYPRAERIPYKLNFRTCPKTGLVEWILEQDGKGYTLKEKIDRPDLLEVVVATKKTPYRGVKVDGKTYWTDNEHHHAELKVAVDTLARAQRKIVELVEEDE